MNIKSFFIALGWSALYLLIVFAVECLGFIHPFLWVYCALFAAPFSVWAYHKLVSNYPYPCITLMPALLLVVVHLATGEGDSLFLILAAAIVTLTELVRYCAGRITTSQVGSTAYQTATSRRWGYAIFALLPFANTLRMWVCPEESMAITAEEMGEQYAAWMTDILSPWLLCACVIATMTIAYICIIGLDKRREKKQAQ